MPIHDLDEAEYRNVTIEHGRTKFAEFDHLHPGRRQQVPAEWLDAAPDTDLREMLDPPQDDLSVGTLRRASRMLLSPGDQFSLWVFLHSADGQPWVMDPRGYTGHSVGNQPLGPLADLQVYATDPYGRYQGKSHGLCIHANYLDSGHELLTLQEFLPLYEQDPGSGPWTGSGWCSKCGGYAIRRLDEEQFAHYWTSVQAAEAAWRNRH